MFEFKSDLLTLEPCNIVGWDILVSIDVWAHVAFFTHFNCIWTRCGLCKTLGQVAMRLEQVVFWVELPVQRRLCPIFKSGVGLPNINEYSAG